jgi:hypothetical protein
MSKISLREFEKFLASGASLPAPTRVKVHQSATRRMARDESPTDRNRTNGNQPYGGQQGERRPVSATSESTNNRNDRDLSAKDQDDDPGRAAAKSLLDSIAGGHKALDRDECAELRAHLLQMYPDLAPGNDLGEGEDPDEDPNNPDQAQSGPEPGILAEDPTEDEPPDFYGKPNPGGRLTGDSARIGFDAAPTQSQQRQLLDLPRQAAHIRKVQAEIKRNIAGADKRRKLAADAAAKRKQRLAQDVKSGTVSFESFDQRYPQAMDIGFA